VNKVKIIDEKGRLFGKISLIDILVVVIVVVLAFAVYTRFFQKEQTAVAVSNDTFTYELKIKSVRDLTANALQVGDVLYDSDNETYLGKISNISVTPSYTESVTADGVYVVAPMENRYDVVLTIDSEGLISAGRYYASRTYELSVNASVGFHTKYLTASAFVWSIDG
jgi:hypothetical protein